MGLRNWWKRNREQSASDRLSLEINSDQDAISTQVPELQGMTEVERMAYVMQQIQDWGRLCTSEEAAEFRQRLGSSNAAWEADGLIMPYWGNLWVLRTYQAQLGLPVPQVAPSVNAE